jgi:polyphosphate kinase
MNTKELLKKYSKPENFINRDLSWVEFNKRVLDEALNPELPLLDKIKFISIFCSNLDEFYMIRVSGIKEQIAANISEPAIDGLTPIEQLNKVEIALKPLLKKLDDLWTIEIIPALKEQGISLISLNELSNTDKEKLTNYFKKEIRWPGKRAG